MTEKRYTKAVGTKFHPDGSLRFFPGNTIISRCLKEPAFSELIWAQDQYRELPFAHKFGFLPPSSSHMTIFELLCDQVRTESHWTSLLPLTASISEADELFKSRLAQVRFPDRIVMSPTGVTLGQAVTIGLRPVDQSGAETLLRLRNVLSQVTGVHFPNHETYRFHITLAYNLEYLTDDELNVFSAVTDRVNARISQSLSPLEVGAPELVFFTNMGDFSAYLVEE